MLERYLILIQLLSSYMLIQLKDDPLRLRPLVFIAHCFGGLVVLKVYNLSISSLIVLTISRLSLIRSGLTKSSLVSIT